VGTLGELRRIGDFAEQLVVSEQIVVVGAMRDDIVLINQQTVSPHGGALDDAQPLTDLSQAPSAF
jgi:hypothetical protein